MSQACPLFLRGKKKKITPKAMKTKHLSSVSLLEEVLLRPLVRPGKPRNKIAHFKDWAVFVLGPELGKNGGGRGRGCSLRTHLQGLT